MNKINCPHCGNSFDVESALSSQLEAQLKKDFEKKLSQEAERFNQEREKLEKEQEEFESKKKQQNEIFKERLEKSLILEKEKIKKELSEASELEIKHLVEENNKRKEENRKLKETEILLKQKEQALLEQQKDLDLEVQKQVLLKQQELEERVSKREKDKFELERLEFQKKLSQQQELAEEQIRKAKQGSMQLQGEVQELAIEEWLISNFPFDAIEEIKKGARGGDCIQIVNTRSRLNCGKIYYESKRTKEFSNQWIEKFKDDIKEKGADIGVIITETMPSDLDRMGIKDGVWICSFEEFKGLSFVLREQVIKVSLAMASQENKGEKMGMLYDYMTSPTFKMQVEGIVDGFKALKDGLEKEKIAMMKIWKMREKQIEKVIINTTEMYGSIQGISGSESLRISGLELDDVDNFLIDNE